MQCSVHLSFNWNLQLINKGIGELQNLLNFFNGTATVSFFRIRFVPHVLPANLVLYLKDLNVSSSAAIALLKLVASSLE